VPYWNGGSYRTILRCILSGSIVEGADGARLKAGIASVLGVENVLLCGSGSLALEIALGACNVGAGDEVVVPSFCCAAIVPPILAVGAIPVLADMGDELNLTVDTVEAVLTRKTKAIVVPHLFGNPADVGAIVELARGRNIRVIDDAAQALGATIAGKPVGSFGDAGIVSFGKQKVCFGLGGGAAILARESSNGEFRLPPPSMAPTLRGFASTLVQWRWRRWTFPLLGALARANGDGPDAPPVPYRRESMANLNAAVATSLLETLQENLSARRARVRAYRDLLEDSDRLELIPHRSGSACLTQVVRMLPRGRHRDLAAEIISTLGRAGYEAQGSYVPIHLLGSYPQCVWDCLPKAERIWGDLIELPCEPSIRLDDVERIASIVKSAVGGCRGTT
jgi:perosamine synthetase